MSKFTKKLKKAIRGAGKTLAKIIPKAAPVALAAVGLAAAIPAYQGIQKYAKKVKAALPAPTGKTIEMAAVSPEVRNNLQAVEEINYEELYLELFIYQYYPEYYEQLYRGGEK